MIYIQIHQFVLVCLKAKWRAEAREVAGSTTASLYATLLVVIYVAFSFTELVRFPHNKDYLEIYGFFTFLYFTATLYLIYILTYVVKQEEGSPRAVENFKVSSKKQTICPIFRRWVGLKPDALSPGDQ